MSAVAADALGQRASRTGARKGPVAVSIALAFMVGGAIAVTVFGRGPVLAALPWVDVTAECLAIAAALGIAIMAVGRHALLQERPSLWIGATFLAYALFATSYVLLYPGLIAGRPLVSAHPNAWAWAFHEKWTALAALLGVSVWQAYRSVRGPSPASVMAAVVAVTGGTVALTVAVAPRLPALVADGAFTPLNVAWTAALTFVLGVAGVAALQRGRSDDQPVLWYAGILALVLAVRLGNDIRGGHVFDVVWYVNRALLVSAFSLMLLGLFVDYLRVLAGERRERAAVAASHEMLRAVFAATPQAIAVLDERGHVTMWNVGAERLFAWRASDVLGRRNPAAPENASGEVRSMLSRALAGELLVDVETRRLTAHGDLIDVSLSTAPVRGPEGQVIGTVAVYVDVRERNAAQARLAASEARFRALIDHARDSITILDAAGRIAYQSPAVEHLLGYTAAGVMGRDVFEFVHPDDAGRIRDILGATAEPRGVIVPFDCRVRHRDGSWRVLEGVGTDLLHEPVVRGLVINARDVTERRQAEAEVLRQQEVLAKSEKLAALGRLAAGVAHELRNPLTVLSGRAAMLRGELADHRAARHLASMDEAVERMRSIVLGLSSYAKPVKAVRAALDVRELASGVVGLVAHEARTSGVTLAVDAGAVPARVLGDPSQITQVFVNLAMNAIEAMAGAGGGQLVLRVVASADVTIEVSDTGPGIPEDRLAVIWDAFYTTKADGSGLGLSIVRGIIEDHGGTVRVDSVVGRGCTFTVRLPAASAGG